VLDVRIPTFSRQTATDTPATDERPTATGTSTSTTPVRPRTDATSTADLPPAPKHASRDEAPTADFSTTPPPPPPSAVPVRERPDTDDRHDTLTDARRDTGAEPVVAGPKPRASLLATLGLILGVASALLVLSGPLLGYGIGVAGLALILSLAGIRATSKRHVAGKSDALIGMVLSLAAIVVGVLALTGSLSWLGTDMQPVNNLREWLDARFADRF
jgi:hypothetical protein